MGVLGDAAAGDLDVVGPDFRRVLCFTGDGIPVAPVTRLGGPNPPEDGVNPIVVGILGEGLVITFLRFRGGTPAVLALDGRW